MYGTVHLHSMTALYLIKPSCSFQCSTNDYTQDLGTPAAGATTGKNWIFVVQGSQKPSHSPELQNQRWWKQKDIYQSDAVVYVVSVWTCNVARKTEKILERSVRLLHETGPFPLPPIPSWPACFHLNCKRDSKVILQWTFFSLSHHYCCGQG